MSPLHADAALVASILNAAFMVRHYGARPHAGYRLRRAAAVQRLGLTVRRAFNQSENFEPLLIAVVDGLRPRPDQEAF